MGKGTRILLMLFAAVLVMAFSYYLHSDAGDDVSSSPAEDKRVKGDPSNEAGRDSYIQLPGLSRNANEGYLPKGKCDIFSGKWVPDPYGPAYNNHSCEFIYPLQNCMSNGRPDIDYLHWRWKPYGCQLPPFDPFRFLDAMKDKSWAFIGDSLFRNHMQSLLCLLSKVEKPVEVQLNELCKPTKWYFPNHNFTIVVFWAPYLVRSESFRDDKDPFNTSNVYLDTLEEEWTSEYKKFDYVIFSSGPWLLRKLFIFENNVIVGCYNCNNKTIKELEINYIYHKILQLAYKFMLSADHKPLIIFRAWSPNHFEFGEWYNGGLCNRTRPYNEGQFDGKSIDQLMRTVEIEEFQKAMAMNLRSRIRLKLLDIFHLSLLRPDGHPGPYRFFHPFAKNKNAKVNNDCVHWCLPGAIDTWNELIMKILVDEGDIW